MYELNEQKLKALARDINIDEIKERLKAFEQISKGEKEGGTIALLPIASRFRWLAATKSTVIQTSAIHPGLCIDPYETLMKLFKQLVL